jgi:hypothetical protein
VDTSSPIPGGTSCGTNLVCNGTGSCIACTAGGACSGNPSVCYVGATRCTTGTPTCIDTSTPKSYGTSCGGSNICSGGSCCAYNVGQSCSYYGPQDSARSCQVFSGGWCTDPGQQAPPASVTSCSADPGLCGAFSDTTSCWVVCNHIYGGTVQCNGTCG